MRGLVTGNIGDAAREGVHGADTHQVIDAGQRPVRYTDSAARGGWSFQRLPRRVRAPAPASRATVAPGSKRMSAVAVSIDTAGEFASVDVLVRRSARFEHVRGHGGGNGA